MSFDAVLDGWDIANYESNRTWASPTPEASCFAKIERKDSIRAIANKLRASIASTEKIWAIGELATAVSNTKIGGIFKVGIEPNDRPVNLKPRPCWANVFPRGEATIEWITPFQGRVLSRKAIAMTFFVGEFGIDIIVSGSFCANEFKNPNYHHAVIRQAVEAGKNFNPASANPSDPSFQSQWCKTANGDITNAGTVCQSCDGWWWAWNDQPTEGKKFLTRSLACKYLEAKYGDRAKSIECLLCV
ncbi:MAG: hypothetical protein HC941_30305 [Microcoleus sp. SU_5_3]|nr:hypothetical protein [Microcoleus sp. SU_5_3]